MDRVNWPFLTWLLIKKTAILFGKSINWIVTLYGFGVRVRAMVFLFMCIWPSLESHAIHYYGKVERIHIKTLNSPATEYYRCFVFIRFGRIEFVDFSIHFADYGRKSNTFAAYVERNQRLCHKDDANKQCGRNTDFENLIVATIDVTK